MNLQFQICSLIVIAVILVIYATHRRLMLRSERVFYRVLFFGTVSLILDTASVIAIHYMNEIPQTLVHFICKLYEANLIFCSVSVLVYLLADILNREQFRALNKYSLFILLAEVAIVSGHSIQINPRGFAYGPAIDAGYIFFATNFAVTLGFLGKYIKKIRRRRLFGIGLWIAIWAVFAAIQMFNPDVQIIGLAVTLGILILFALLEKPESKLDKQYGCFNYFALINYLDEMVEAGTSLFIVSVSVKTNGTLTGDSLYNNGILVLGVLERQRKAHVFRGINQDFICIAKKKMYIDQLAEELQKEASLFPEEACYARVTRCNETTAFSSSSEILQFMNYLRTKDNEQSLIFNANTELVQSFHNRKSVEIELRNALIENRIETFFQPIYSVHEKRITSCEALARIRTRDGGIIMPSEFIPIAEENGSILELGYKIFEQTCTFIASHKDLLEYIEVNLSVVQCEDDHMSDKLIAIMEKYNVHPSKINLEITETASIVTKQKLLKNMQRMLEYGVTFSLDDFGKGESNLMYVVDMMWSDFSDRKN